MAESAGLLQQPGQGEALQVRSIWALVLNTYSVQPSGLGRGSRALGTPEMFFLA